MSAFLVKDHILPGQHIREYPHATTHSQEDVLEVAIKQYTPKEVDPTNLNGAVTIITANGNGFPKVSPCLCYSNTLGPSNPFAGDVRASFR